jgi:hypothetical protein
LFFLFLLLAAFNLCFFNFYPPNFSRRGKLIFERAVLQKARVTESEAPAPQPFSKSLRYFFSMRHFQHLT